jgi:hypothetical protein
VTLVPKLAKVVDVVPVPPLAIGSVPVTPVVKGSPVAFVSVAEEGVPKAGVTNVGLVDNTLLPEPVEAVTPVPPLATGSVPVTPVVKGSPVAFVSVTEVGVPKIGVTSVGLVANTLAPLPVSSVKAAAKLAEEGVAKNVATFAPKPLTPVLIGRPVALVKVAEVGVPKIGVTKVGLVDNTLLPEPVEVVTPVPPEVTGSAVPRAKVAK